MQDDIEWLHEYVERRVVDTEALIAVDDYLDHDPDFYKGRLQAFEELRESISAIIKNRKSTVYKQLDKCTHSEVNACAACRINHMQNHIATVEAELQRLADARVAFIEGKYTEGDGNALCFAVERAIDACL